MDVGLVVELLDEGVVLLGVVARLVEAGYTTIGMLAATDPRVLERRLGRLGPHVHRLAHAQDPRPVQGRRTARSVGSERTLVEDTIDRGEITEHLRRAADGIGRRWVPKRWWPRHRHHL